MPETTCDYCGESVEGDPIRRGNKVYCSDACAFEATRSADCSGRTDSTMSSEEKADLANRLGGRLR